jgi:uncharacterized protein YndB with AHSA1/START domain
VTGPMNDRTIAREILIEAPTDVVWRTITEPDQIARWFADRVELDLRSAGEGKLVFDDKATGKTTTVPVVVDSVDPLRRLAYRWSQPEGEAATPANSVLVEFTLTAEGEERTRLRVVESGLDGLDWSDEAKDAYAEDHNDGWAHHFGRLVELFAARSG